jgi:Na+-driven multidrug efflux pump
MGVVGAAWATLGARTIALLVGFVALAQKRGIISMRIKDWAPTRRGWVPLINIAWPNSAQFLLRIAVIEFYHILIVRLFTTGTDATTATAYAICVRLETLVLFISMGWGAAASTYVGQNLGAGDRMRAVRSGWLATGYNTGFVLMAQVLFLFGAEPLIGFFSDSPDVLAVGIDYLRIVGASYLLFGVGIVLSQALTGAGATMLGFGLDLVVLLGVAIPATFVVMAMTTLTEDLTWILIAGGNALTGIVYMIWYRKGGWLSKEV